VISVDDHPSLAVAAFVTELPAPLGELPSPDWLQALLAPGAEAPFRPEEPLRVAVRDVLRSAGYKPTGRGKPASEYLARAAAEGGLGPINLVVDAGNAVSLHAGLPVSVVDLDRARPPLRIGVAPMGASYAFNAAGQVIELGGLPCLFDADGPCANAVKDAQRTKTGHATRRTLSIVWGARAFPDRLCAAEGWYRELLARTGASTLPDEGR
jgi:DNA/RNA-binding domain of Phe-tRNA-synthetase-like protein